MLAAGNTPDFKAISEFRRRHLSAFKDLFVKVLQLRQQAGMVTLGHVAIDGTKIKAYASKHKAMSYGRMKEEEARLKAEIQRPGGGRCKEAGDCSGRGHQPGRGCTATAGPGGADGGKHR